MFVDVRDKVKRLELVEFLEQEGFAFDKERIVNSVLPVILNFVDCKRQ